MKRFTIVLMLLLVTVYVCGETNVSGIISEATTWDLPGSPYIVVGDVTVEEGVELTINSGVYILFLEEMSLIINGILIAGGSEEALIYFDSHNPLYKWNGIKFMNTDGSSLLKFCDITYSHDSGISIANSSNIKIDNCNIHKNSSDEGGGGINIKEQSSEVLIKYSTISQNTGNLIDDEIVGGGGISCVNSEDITIKYNDIYDNVNTFGGGGIYSLSNTNCLVYQNEIYGNMSNEGGGGIYMEIGFDNSIIKNFIYSNTVTNYSLGGGIYLVTASDVIENEIYDNSAGAGSGVYIKSWRTEKQFSNNLIHHNIASGYGGGVFITDCIDYLDIQDCKIYSNQANRGGGIYITYECLNIHHCEIFDNSAISNNSNPGLGGGIYSMRGKPQIERSEIRDNHAGRFGGGIYFYNTTPYWGEPISRIDHCVITGNHAGRYGGGMYLVGIDDETVSSVACYNSIFYENSAYYDRGKDIFINTFANGYFSFIKYNRYDRLHAGLNPDLVILHENISADPEFNNFDDYDFTLLPDSPCIDTGDPDGASDPDGTRTDMGIIPFHHACDIKYFHADYNWVSFPRLPMDEHQNENQFVTADNIVDDITPFPRSLRLLHEIDYAPYALTYDNSSWSQGPQSYEMCSSRGYKFKTKNPENTQITVDGSRLVPETAIDLIAGENWIGYWLPESQNINDAFGEAHFDKIISVKAEDWEWKPMPTNDRDGNDYITAQDYYPMQPFQYGKGYVVTLEESINSFQWQTGVAAIVKEIPKAQHFEFTVLPDYESVMIDTIINGEDVIEVGAFVDDRCVGAAVVEKYPVQLLAYTEGANRSTELTFQVIEAGRSIAKDVNYTTLNIEMGKFENRALCLGNYPHNIVSLEKNETANEQPFENFCLKRNHPNPFTGETTISFSLTTNLHEKARIDIFNIRGQKVKTLFSGLVKSGQHEMVWNGTDANDKAVSSGVYFYKLKIGNKELT
ncbi:MAG: T9SS type A sorting domain-containing protein, partial [Candidatus Cloacimonetes bacterium]|nr:T9SS type A sorting domain-containing protein [Candidatus Cloacimonadota bacterium]